MKYKVLRRFKTPSDLEPFSVGSDFQTDDKKLAESLIKAGLIKENKKPDGKAENKKKKDEKKDK